MNDTERLDFLESTKKVHGYGWLLRDSTTGRGMRLHETSSSHPTVRPTIREAIDAYQESLKEVKR